MLAPVALKGQQYAMGYAPAGHYHFNTSLCFPKHNNSIIVWAGLVLIGTLGAIMTKTQLGFRCSYHQPY